MRLSSSLVLLLLLASGCLPTRYVAYNFADITDFRKFPERPLPASSTPFKFANPEKPLSPKPSLLAASLMILKNT